MMEEGGGRTDVVQTNLVTCNTHNGCNLVMCTRNIEQDEGDITRDTKWHICTCTCNYRLDDTFR